MKVHVNLTTWVKRDKYVPVMLEHFQKQTLKADKIILWLSREEYDEKHLPEHLAKCLAKGLLTDIMWVDKNTYCHKRHECFKHFNDAYNVFIDDDIKYKPNFLEELVSASEKHPDCITCTASRAKYYKGTGVEMADPTPEPSYYNGPMGCWMCIPPGVFPMESFGYADVRDRYCPKCDESWLMAWCLKKNTKIHVLYSHTNYLQDNIGESQKDALYNENKLRGDNIRVKERMLANAIKIVGVEKEAKEIWPEFDIEATASFKDYEKIICAMTSWMKRIGNVPKVMDSLLANYIKPDKIVLTLAEEEFPNKEIPADVAEYIKAHKEVQLNWVKKNTKVWKKILPVFKLYPKDCIICVDDDMLYPKHFIHSLWFKHLQYPHNPIAASKTVINGFLQHGGCCTLDKLEYYGDILKVVDEHPEIMKDLRSSDTFFQYMAVRNGTPCMSAGVLFGSTTIQYNEVEPWSTTLKEANMVWEYLKCIVDNKYKDSLRNNPLYLPFFMDNSDNLTQYEKALIQKYKRKYPKAHVSVRDGWLYIHYQNDMRRYKI